jgi:peptide/nickel transport system substrate-binding protein
MKKISRRSFLQVSVSAATGVVVAACATQAPPATVAPPAPVKAATSAAPAPTKAAAPTAASAAAISTFKEAPMLADLVKTGKLPPLEQRLPKQPRVITNAQPSEWLTPEIGRHGGTLRLAGPGIQYDNDGYVMFITPLVFIPGIAVGKDLTPQPHLLSRFEVSPDLKVFTCVLREGLKWSDGKPVTTKDVQFAYEDVLLNTELTAAGMPAWLRTAGQGKGDPMVIEIIDDFTFKISFKGPYGGFPVALGVEAWRSYHDLIKPRHYLEQFHKKYADPAKLDALIKENKFQTWVQLYTFKDNPTSNFMRQQAIGQPMLTPWIPVESSDERVIMERNPYYCAVDSAGNQLPYFDKIDYRRVADLEVLAVKQIAGEVDYGAETITMPKLTIYKENETKGNYNLRVGNLHRTSGVMFMNMTHSDESWRKVIRDIRFRQALNMAIDRKEIIDAVYFGYGDPSPLNPNKYDAEGAEKLLDEMGMNKKDAEGFRLAPDGKPFSILIESITNFFDMPPAMELYSQFWNAIGIKTTSKIVDNSLLNQRINANEVQAYVLMEQSTQWHRRGYGQSFWAPLWWKWWTTAGQQGEEPPTEVKEFYTKADRVLTLAPEDGRKLVSECEKMLYDNLWYFIPAINQKQARIENKKLGNMSINPLALSIVQSISMQQAFFKA